MPGKIEGKIASSGPTGNLVTDIVNDRLKGVPASDSAKVICDEHETVGIWRTYSDQPPMTLMALVGSNGKLELAIVDDSA